MGDADEFMRARRASLRSRTFLALLGFTLFAFGIGILIIAHREQRELELHREELVERQLDLARDRVDLEDKMREERLELLRMQGELLRHLTSEPEQEMHGPPDGR
ncbi:MAG: hypothetical protein AAGE52_30430 [Myxococcota bacterium]